MSARHSRISFGLLPNERQLVYKRKEFQMIALFTIGLILFTAKLVHFAFKAALGITKGVLCVIGLPALLIVLFVAGLMAVALPLLALGLLAAFLLPILKRR